jgi:hypothetical protein
MIENFKRTFNTIMFNKASKYKILLFSKHAVVNPLQVFSKDPKKFSEAMDSFKLHGVFKSTKADRHHETQKFLKEYIDKLQKPVVILDVGASDGTTSLQLINLIENKIEKFYVTDYNIKCNYIKENGFTYFFNTQSDNCFLIASNTFVFYPENKRLFNLFFNKSLTSFQNKSKTELLLCNHELKLKANNDDRIEILDYDIFKPWQKKKPDIIVVGNLLHPTYFSNEDIYRALNNCYITLKDNGILVIIRNSWLSKNCEVELSVIYKKNNMKRCFQQIFEVNGGVEINEFVLSSRF